jgi:signal transduction histidine kinase
MRGRAATRYATAVLVAIAAIYVREILQPLMGHQNPYHIAWFAVVVSAWYLGLGPSILTVAIETLGVWYFLLLPQSSFKLNRESAASLVGFVCLSGLIVLLGETNRRSVQRRNAAEAQLIEYKDALEKTVAQRTEELVDANSELSRLSTSLLQAQDDERRRLALELHDSVGSLLAALGMHMAQIQEGTADSDPSLSAIAGRSEALVQQVTQEIRTASYLLHPPLLEEFGLVEALRHYVQGFSERSGLKVDLAVTEGFDRLEPEMELSIFRVVQECLTNIHRHSGSEVAAVRFWRERQEVHIEVKDEGRGISAAKLAAVNSSISGVGLAGIRQRIRHFGGNVNIQSDSMGTKVSATLLLSEATAQPERAVQPATGAA